MWVRSVQRLGQLYTEKRIVVAQTVRSELIFRLFLAISFCPCRLSPRACGAR